jgi:hypothetical protein
VPPRGRRSSLRGGRSRRLRLSVRMLGFVDVIVQHPAKEQGELRVRVKVPGSWFPGLSAAERGQDYEAEAYDSAEAHRFEKSGSRAAQTCAAIKFICVSDLQEDPNATGRFIMGRLSVHFRTVVHQYCIGVLRTVCIVICRR